MTTSGGLKVGDHVRLADHSAAQMAARRNWRSTAKVNWPKRRGIVIRQQLYGDHLVGVQWDGRTSIDWWRPQLLTVIEE